jgi:hypothetical protein
VTLALIICDANRVKFLWRSHQPINGEPSP